MTGIILKTKLIFRTEFIFAKSNASVKYMHQSKCISQNTSERKEEEFQIFLKNYKKIKAS